MIAQRPQHRSGWPRRAPAAGALLLLLALWTTVGLPALHLVVHAREQAQRAELARWSRVVARLMRLAEQSPHAHPAGEAHHPGPRHAHSGDSPQDAPQQHGQGSGEHCALALWLQPVLLFPAPPAPGIHYAAAPAPLGITPWRWRTPQLTRGPPTSLPA